MAAVRGERLTDTGMAPGGAREGTEGRADAGASASPRAAAVVAGAALAAMAVIAPIGMLVALPGGQFALAGIVALAVAILDVVAAVALWAWLRADSPLGAPIAAAPRIAYAAVFAGAAGFLVAPTDPDHFSAVWDAGLFVFGAHLVALGVVAVRAGRLPAWIGVLVVVAGAGYATDTVLALAAPSSSVSIGTVSFVGEVVLIVWLLGWAGRARTTPTAEVR